MQQNRRILRWCWAIPLLVWIGCSAVGAPDARRQPPEHPPPAADVHEQASPADTQSIALRTALVPDATPQPVRIRLHERRETISQDVGKVTHELKLDLTATLTRAAPSTDGGVEVKLVFKHIKLNVGMPDRPETKLAYDSATDKPNTGNPLADVMAHVAGAELALRIGPSGRLRGLHGLDVRWRKANLLMAPPALLTAQWLFRDAGMKELVAEALFPPMPAGPVRIGDAWEVDVPANIPLVARLNARVRSTLKRITRGADGVEGPTARIEGAGKIEPAPEILEGDTPAIHPIVKTGSVKITQDVIPSSQSLAQRSERTTMLAQLRRAGHGDAADMLEKL